MVNALDQINFNSRHNTLEQEEEKEWPDFLPDDQETEGNSQPSFQDGDSDVDIPEDPYQVRT